MKPKGPNRRFSHRLVVPAVLVAGLLLPFVFIRAAFLALDARAASICPSISCLGWTLRPRLLLDSSQVGNRSLATFCFFPPLRCSSFTAPRVDCVGT
ncbi:Glycosyl transferase family 8 [Musa troglodytarum]|uniref:Glycosyl transferase family 8 n=1 Tax=Musa troglodytarum TaxID=320322 RepID=A0A9E7HZR6_9LILI|nr:Glycosyl transferase family 8 [Musa troglodytarum]